MKQMKIQIHKNKKFMMICIILSIVLFIALYSMRFTIGGFSYKSSVTIANVEGKNYESMNDSVIADIRGEYKMLSSQEAKETLNLDFFYKLMDIFFIYRMNHIEDYRYVEQYDSNGTKMKELSKEEYIEALLTPCTIIENEVYGDVIYLRGDYNVFMQFTPDGKNVNVDKSFNYTNNQRVEVDLDQEKINQLINYAKEFFQHFSEKLATKFHPQYCYLDETGHIYVMIDIENHMRFDYDLLYNCPTVFRIGFDK